MHEILDHHEIVADLEHRLKKLANSYSAMIEQAPNTEHVGLFTLACKYQLEMARPGGNAVAQRILTHLVTDRERAGTTFWGTPLGRACGWWTGAGTVQATEEQGVEVSTMLPRVALLLGVSRQAAHQMVTRGQLRKNSLTGVEPEGVRREMQSRFPMGD